MKGRKGRNNSLRIDSIEIKATQTNLIEESRLGIMVRYARKKGIFKQCCKLLPAPMSNNGYSPEEYVKTLYGLMVMYPEQRAPLERIDEMRESEAIRLALGMKAIPTAKATGDWLRRMAGCETMGRDEEGCPVLKGYEEGLERVQELFYSLAVGTLRAVSANEEGILDFDASCLYGKKSCDRWMYNKEKGSMAYLSFWGRICVMAELEEGNHSPSDHIGERLRSAVEVCERGGKEVKVIRSDSAGYESGVINDCREAGRDFYIRADLDSAVRAACAGIKNWRNYEIEIAGGQRRTVELGFCVHAMEKTKEAFTLVVERQPLKEKDEQQEVLPGIEGVRYKYTVTATSAEVVMPEEKAEAMCSAAEAARESGSRTRTIKTPVEVVETYNDRGDSENRIKELKADVGIDRLPTRELEANRVCMYLRAMFHNLFELFKYECLEPGDRGKRLPTVMRELLHVPGKVTLKAHKLTLDLAVHMKRRVAHFLRLLEIMRKKIRALRVKRLGCGELIYRHQE